ncbi:hypothetical protein acsn021_40150 [Anaerocolumna cellulosilytica]|uniref:Uncharacterized protein n=1 Tax=Anaerocolumna cellulosilytica TaxID=433286 RepID=A0A6S6R2S6_9FIRM|nr:DUF2975 domain-containing protein [Anaerocolumna cellulosilytica]MBB5197789.1 cellulose synthase/poly-beta-1,6-N-acetylglucosamine synthase-like glycosyltransferase [Anaerocolumna cellulosilytica]BCJ96446.1 hypothetical protein acsn021_40150 [Anaerocolumna cellulosilytica]
MRQKEMAVWLNGIAFVAGTLGIVFLIVLLPELSRDFIPEELKIRNMRIVFQIFIWITAVPCYLSLWKFLKICQNVKQDNSFCIDNALSLKSISKFILIDCCIYIVGGSLLFVAKILHPLILLLIILILFVGCSLTILSMALSHLVLKACELKQENDLTI